MNQMKRTVLKYYNETDDLKKTTTTTKQKEKTKEIRQSVYPKYLLMLIGTIESSVLDNVFNQ
jgi:hypothetical protein